MCSLPYPIPRLTVLLQLRERRSALLLGRLSPNTAAEALSELCKLLQNAGAFVSASINGGNGLLKSYSACIAFLVKIAKLNENKSPNKLFVRILTTPYVYNKQNPVFSLWCSHFSGLRCEASLPCSHWELEIRLEKAGEGGSSWEICAMKSPRAWRCGELGCCFCSETSVEEPLHPFTLQTSESEKVLIWIVKKEQVPWLCQEHDQVQSFF